MTENEIREVLKDMTREQLLTLAVGLAISEQEK